MAGGAGVTSVTLRAATPSDAAQIARFHVAEWRAAYHALAPAEADAQLDEARRLPGWQASLAAPPPSASRIALQDLRLVGLVSVGQSSLPIYDGRGEVKHLYVSADQRGTGLGRKLLTLGRDLLRQAGYPRAGLTVVAENHAARGFYAHCGGVETGHFTDPGPLWRSENILITFD